MHVKQTILVIALVLCWCCSVEINAQLRETTTTTAAAPGRITTTKTAVSTADAVTTGPATTAAVTTASTTAPTSTSTATTTVTTTTYKPNITSYEDAVVVLLETSLTTEEAQSIIFSEFDWLFISYCVNVSCSYMPLNTSSSAPVARLPFYIVLFLESAVNNVQAVTNLTLSVLYHGDFLPANVLVDFFKTARNSFTDIVVLNSVTYASANPPPMVCHCEDTSGYIAAIIILSIVAVALLIGLIVLAVTQNKKSRSGYDDFKDGHGQNMSSSGDNERAHIDPQSSMYH